MTPVVTSAMLQVYELTFVSCFCIVNELNTQTLLGIYMELRQGVLKTENCDNPAAVSLGRVTT